MAQRADDQSLKQLKEELGSLKGIMLSRHQFPPTPTRGSVANGGGIPVWQRAGVSSDTGTPIKRSVDQPHEEEVKVNGIMEGNGSEIVLQNGNGTVLQNENGTVVKNGNRTAHTDENLLDENGTS